MLKLFLPIFSTARRQQDRSFERIIDSAIEKTIDGTDPRLRAARAWSKRLRSPVTNAVHFVIDAVDSMPAPVLMSADTFAGDPQVRALFANIDSLQQAFSRDPAMRDYAAAHSAINGDNIYVGLALTLTKKQVFVPALRDGSVRRDVARTSVSFGEPRCIGPADDEATLRRQIKERLFMILVECALSTILGARDYRLQLEKQRTLLQAKLRHVKARGLGQAPLVSSRPGSLNNPSAIEKKLDEIERELGGMPASTETLDESLVRIANVMSEPERHLRVRNTSIRLNHMNFLSEIPDAEEDGDDIFYTEFETSDGRNAVGRLVVYPRRELRRETGIDYARHGLR